MGGFAGGDEGEGARWEAARWGVVIWTVLGRFEVERRLGCNYPEWVSCAWTLENIVYHCLRFELEYKL